MIAAQPNLRATGAWGRQDARPTGVVCFDTLIAPIGLGFKATGALGDNLSCNMFRVSGGIDIENISSSGYRMQSHGGVY